MKRVLRVFYYLLLAAGALLAVRSVDVTLSRTVTLAGPAGAPLQAYAAWYYRGYRLNFVRSVTWTRPGGVAKSNSDGEIHLPWTIALKSPLDGGLKHAVEMIYLPALHEARGLPTLEDAGRITWTDRSGDPEAWERSLSELRRFIANRLVFGNSDRFAVASEMTAELVALLRTEYDPLVGAPARTPRTMPREPAHLQFGSESERTAWRGKMARDIADIPLWGPWIERHWADRIEKLEAGLKH